MFAPRFKAPKATTASQTPPTRTHRPSQRTSFWLRGPDAPSPFFAPSPPKQSKLLEESNDPREHEADHVADQVMRTQMGPPPFLQRKLAIGQVNDPLEHEADRVAEAVL